VPGTEGYSLRVNRVSELSGIELAVARTLADAVNPTETYGSVLAQIGTALGWPLGTVWEVSPGGQTLRCVAVWEAPDEDVQEFRKLSERLTLAPGEGLPGRVWETGDPAWIGDVVEDENFPRARAAAAVGLRGALSFPIRSPHGIVGTMEFFTRDHTEPDDALLACTAVLGSLVGQFVVRRRAEASARHDEALTQAILRSAIDAVITMDEWGRVLEFNPAAERMFGYSRDEAIGEDLGDLVVPPSLRDGHRRGLARYLESGGGNYLDRRVEIRGMRSDGREFPVELTITQIDLPGSPVFTGFIRDITERKLAEEELAASRARLVESADTERRRLERNLHDGAQQHLVGLSLKLGLASASLEARPQRARRLLDESREDLELALEELRELARGIHPAVLTERGLRDALAALGDRSPVEVAISALPPERLPERVEVAVYFLVAEALTNVARYADVDRATVSIRREEAVAIVEVSDRGRGGASMEAGTGLRGLADRVEALGGTLELDSPVGGGTRLRAAIPT
jgi:PAS domain S-box-containing protein